MTNLLFKNHNPIVSIKTKTIRANMNCIMTDVVVPCFIKVILYMLQFLMEKRIYGIIQVYFMMAK